MTHCQTMGSMRKIAEARREKSRIDAQDFQKAASDREKRGRTACTEREEAVAFRRS